MVCCECQHKWLGNGQAWDRTRTTVDWVNPLDPEAVRRRLEARKKKKVWGWMGDPDYVEQTKEQIALEERLIKYMRSRRSRQGRYRQELAPHLFLSTYEYRRAQRRREGRQ